MLGYYNYTVILTYVGMLIGFTGITCAIDGRYEAAILCLMGAGVCDMFDGTIAATKKRDMCEKYFGIQIDSLSDLICFGVLPAVLFYCIDRGRSGSVFICSVYVLCALIRLAYYNVDEAARQTQNTEPRAVYYGLPVTLAALIIPVISMTASLLKFSVIKGYGAAMLCMAVCFLLPFPLKKPRLIGKICAVICGGFEILFLLAGVDL